MNTLLRKNTKKSVEFINEQVDKKSLNRLLSQIYLEFGGAKTATLANNLKMGTDEVMVSNNPMHIRSLIESVKQEFEQIKELYYKAHYPTEVIANQLIDKTPKEEGNALGKVHNPVKQENRLAMQIASLKYGWFLGILCVYCEIFVLHDYGIVKLVHS